MVSVRAFDLAMQIERERFLAAGHYERTPERRGHATATLLERIDTPAGTMKVQAPKTAGHEVRARPSPQSLKRGRRSRRAVMPHCRKPHALISSGLVNYKNRYLSNASGD